MAIITESATIKVVVKGIQGLLMTISEAEIIGFAGDEVSFVVNLSSVNEFARQVTLETMGLPAGSVVRYSTEMPFTVAPGFSAGVIVAAQLPASNDIVGEYVVTVTATSAW